MKKMILALLALVGFAGCASVDRVTGGERDPAATQNVDWNKACLSDFAKGVQHASQLLKGGSSAYPPGLITKLSQEKTNAKVSCIKNTLPPYGFSVSQNPPRITIENQVPDLPKLFDSEVGKAAIEKYKVDLHFVTYDRIMVALAAHTYAELARYDDTNFEVFFETLQILQNQQN